MLTGKVKQDLAICHKFFIQNFDASDVMCPISLVNTSKHALLVFSELTFTKYLLTGYLPPYIKVV